MYEHAGIKYISHNVLSESTQAEKDNMTLQKHTVELKDGVFWNLRGVPKWECGKLFHTNKEKTREIIFECFDYCKQGGTHDPRYFYFKNDLSYFSRLDLGFTKLEKYTEYGSNNLIHFHL